MKKYLSLTLICLCASLQANEELIKAIEKGSWTFGLRSMFVPGKDYAKFQSRKRKQRSLLHTAVLYKRAKIAKKLVGHGVRLDLCDADGHTALDYACMNCCDNESDCACTQDCLQMCKLLLQSNANPNIPSAVDQFTPLGHAILNNAHAESLCRILLNERGDPDKKCDIKGYTPLSLVAERRVSDPDGTGYKPFNDPEDVKLCQLLFNAGAGVSKINDNRSTALHVAVEKNKPEICQLLLDAGADRMMRDHQDSGQIPLHRAMKNHACKEVLSILLSEKKREQLACIDSNSRTPLHLASIANNLPVVNGLISTFGVLIDPVDNDGKTPLYCAIENSRDNSHYAMCEFLIKNRASLTCKSKKKQRSLLHAASASGQNKIVELLISYGADVNLPDAEGLTPLHLACENKRGNMATCELLLKNGAKTRAQDGVKRYEPFHYACDRLAGTLAIQLLESKYDIPLLTRSVPCTPLHLACKRGHSALATKLIKKGIEINRPAAPTVEHDAKTPLHFAVEARVESLLNERDLAAYLSFCDVLIKEHKAEPAIRSLSGMTPLDSACIKNNKNMVEKLVGTEGRLVHNRDVHGQTPLHHAARMGHEDICRYLLELRDPPNIDTEDNQKNTPLHLAARQNKPATCSVLLQKGSRASAVNKEGFMPIHCAAAAGSYEACKALLENGAQLINCLTSGGARKSALHLAVENNHDATADLLIEYGADKTLEDGDGNTLLHYAAQAGNVDFFAQLFDGKEIDPDIRNLAGKKSEELLDAVSRSEKEARATSSLLTAPGTLLRDRFSQAQTYSTSKMKPSDKVVSTYTQRIVLEATQQAQVITRKHTLSAQAFAGLQGRGGAVPSSGRSSGRHYRKIATHRQAKVSDDNDAEEVVITSTTSAAPDDYVIAPAPKNLTRADVNLLSSIEEGTEAEFMSALLEHLKTGGNLDATWNRGESALYIAVKKGQYKLAEFLLDQGAQVDIENEEGMWPLALAAQSGNEKMFALLVSAKADLKKKSPEGRTIAHFAAQAASDGLLKKIKKLGIEDYFTAADTAGQTPLHVACSEGSLATVKFLMANGAGVMPKDTKGRTVLHNAAQKDRKEICALLLKRGAGPLIKDASGLSSWDELIQNGNTDSIEPFLAKLSKTVAVGPLLWKAVFETAKLGHHKLCLKLVKQCKKVPEQDDVGMTPLHYACLYGHTEVVKALLEQDDRTNWLSKRDRSDRLPIHCACIRNCPRSVTSILTKKPGQIKEAAGNQDTPLHLASRAGFGELCKLLLTRGAAIDEKNGAGASPLHLACAQGHNDVVEMLIERGGRVNVVDHEGSSLLHYASQNAGVTGIIEHEKMYAPLINRPNYRGLLPLHFTALLGHNDLLRWIIRKTPKAQLKDMLDAIDSEGYTPLQLAAENGRLETCKILIEAGADVNKNEDQQKLTPLYTACQQNNLKLADLLLKNGAAPLLKTRNANTVLHAASAYNDTGNSPQNSLILRLLDAKVGFARNSSRGDTPIHIACAQGALDTCKKLVEYKPRPHPLGHPDNTGRTPIMVAVEKNHLPIVDYLLSHGSSIENTTMKSETLLHLAARQGHSDIAKLLLTRKKIDVNGRGGEEMVTPLFEAIIGGHVGTCEELLRGGARLNPGKNTVSGLHLSLTAHPENRALMQCLLEENSATKEEIDVVDNEGMAPLHRSVEEGNLEACRLLLEKGADIDRTDEGEQRNTALHIAVFQNYPHMCKLLLSKGANRNSLNALGVTPLMVAAMRGYEDIVFLLLLNKADTNIKDGAGLTALHCALGTDHDGCSRLLIDHGADLTLVTDKKISPLHLAASKGNSKLCSLLIKKGSDPNGQDDENRTPLFHAAENGHSATCQVLLEGKAQRSLSDKDGKIPLHQAAKNGHDETCRMLLSSLSSNEKFVQLNWATSGGITPLCQAVKGGHLDLAKYLVHTGANQQCKDQRGWTLLHFAAYQGDEEMCKYLLGLKIPIDQFSNNGYTPLLCAITGVTRPANVAAGESQAEVLPRSISMCKLLINSYGASLRPVCKQNEKCMHDEHPTALHVAAKLGAGTTAALLLKLNKDLVNVQIEDGETPLHWAILGGKDRLVHLLMREKTTKTTCCDKNGETPLHYACKIPLMNKKYSEKSELIAKTIAITSEQYDPKSKFGVTPLHYTFQAGSMRMIRFLLELGADLNSIDSMGNTVLHYAARGGSIEACAFCIERGLNPDKENNAHETPRSLATGNDYLLKVLQSEVVRRSDDNDDE